MFNYIWFPFSLYRLLEQQIAAIYYKMVHFNDISDKQFMWTLFFLSLLSFVFFSSVNHSFPFFKNNDPPFFLSFILLILFQKFLDKLITYLSFNKGHIPNVRKKMEISKTPDQTWPKFSQLKFLTSSMNSHTENVC